MLEKLESILFVASKPLTTRQLAKAVGKQPADVAEAIATLQMKYNRDDSGIWLFVEGETVQMGTNPASADAIQGFVKDEVSGELTKAQLETLTVVAYRGPMTRAEIEEIRGVNCSVILRNLLIRGLIDEKQDDEKLAMVYSLSMDALRELGVASADQLPDFESLRTHEHLDQAST